MVQDVEAQQKWYIVCGCAVYHTIRHGVVMVCASWRTGGRRNSSTTMASLPASFSYVFCLLVFYLFCLFAGSSWRTRRCVRRRCRLWRSSPLGCRRSGPPSECSSSGHCLTRMTRFDAFCFFAIPRFHRFSEYYFVYRYLIDMVCIGYRRQSHGRSTVVLLEGKHTAFVYTLLGVTKKKNWVLFTSNMKNLTIESIFYLFISSYLISSHPTSFRVWCVIPAYSSCMCWTLLSVVDHFCCCHVI